MLFTWDIEVIIKLIKSNSGVNSNLPLKELTYMLTILMALAGTSRFSAITNLN